MQLHTLFVLLLPLHSLSAGAEEEVPTVPDQQEQGETSEALPEPLELRGGRRPPFSSQSSSINRNSIYRRPTSSIAEKFIDTAYGNDKFDGLYSKSAADNEFGNMPAASSSIVDNYASESGYGHSCSSGYVNASAVALLAFLFLLNLVQDIIQEVTAENMARKRRAIHNEEDELEAMQFIRDGGLDAMKEGLPDIVIPLMIKLSTTNETECIMRPICDANAEIAGKYGEIGKVLGALLSNIASHAFSSKNAHYFDIAQRAAYHGRMHRSCHIYESCIRRGSG